MEILKSLFAHAEHLRRYRGYANNWLIVESRVLYVLGVLFPEFKRAPVWREEGERRLADEIERQIFPDGADWEFSPGYHMMACGGFIEPYRLARLNGLRLPASFEERLPRTFDYIAGMSRPDGTLPSVNDSGGYRGDASAGYLRLGAELFGRKDLLESREGPTRAGPGVFPTAASISWRPRRGRMPCGRSWTVANPARPTGTTTRCRSNSSPTGIRSSSIPGSPGTRTTPTATT